VFLDTALIGFVMLNGFSHGVTMILTRTKKMFE